MFAQLSRRSREDGKKSGMKDFAFLLNWAQDQLPTVNLSALAGRLRTMQAVQFSEARGPHLAEVPVPEPGPHDALIRILRAAICRQAGWGEVLHGPQLQWWPF